MSIQLSKHYYILSLAITLLFSAAPMSFGQQLNEQHPEEMQDEPWVTAVPCKGDSKREGHGFIRDREFWLCFDFDPKALQPHPDGNPNNSSLTITSYTKIGAKNLTGIDFVRMYSDEYPGLEIESAKRFGGEQKTGYHSIQKFKTRIRITRLARSAKYPIGLTMISGTDSSEQLDWRLPVLALSGVLDFVKKKSHAFVDCWAGSKCSQLQLELHNKVPYTLTISNISIYSEDLLEDKPVDEYSGTLDANSGPLDRNVIMKAKPMTFSRVFTGFGKPQATVRVDFKDEYGRTLYAETISELQIRPDFLIIALFLILGAVIGTLVRIDLARLEKAGVITKKQRLIFASTTFASGIIICLITLFADIKLIVWSDQNSFSVWDPKVLFLTAIVATVSGFPILYAYLKLPRPNNAAAPLNSEAANVYKTNV